MTDSERNSPIKHSTGKYSN